MTRANRDWMDYCHYGVNAFREGICTWWETYGVFLGLAGCEREREREGIESSEGSVKGSLAVNPSKHFSRGWSCTRTFSLSLSLPVILLSLPYVSLSLSLSHANPILSNLPFHWNAPTAYIYFYIYWCA